MNRRPDVAPRPNLVRGDVFAAIPRVVHQTWKTSDVPEAWAAYRSSWLERHSSWRHRLWTDADNRRLIAEHHPWFLATYDSFPRHIQRVDAAKYFIVYTHGGVYADLDCECLRPVDALTQRGGAVVGKTRDGVIEGAFFASPPGHPLWELVFSEMQSPAFLARACRGIGYGAAYVLFSTGPRMLKRAVRKYAAQCAGRDGAPGLTIWGPQHLSSRSWLKRHEPFDRSDTFLRHHYSDSWLSPTENAIHSYITARSFKLAAAGMLLAAIVVLASAVW